MRKFSGGTATVAATAAYAAVYWFKLPLATYKPVEGVWQAGRGSGAGIGMMWYGLAAAAVLAGAAAGFVFPEPRATRGWNAAQWLLPLALMFLIAVHESHGFFALR